MTREQELQIYRERVDTAAKLPLEDTIFNGSAEHAQIVVAALMRNAKHTAHAVAGGLNNRVWGHPDTIEAVRGFLDRGGSLSIVIDEEIDRDQSGANYFCNAFRGRFKLQRAAKTQPFHFLETDGNSIRLEPDKQKRTATAFLNQPGRVAVFAAYFKAISLLAKPLQA